MNKRRRYKAKGRRATALARASVKMLYIGPAAARLSAQFDADVLRWLSDEGCANYEAARA